MKSLLLSLFTLALIMACSEDSNPTDDDNNNNNNDPGHDTVKFGTWEWLDSWNDNSFFGVHLIDYNNAWAVGNGGTIIFTTDGGTSWDNRHSGWSYDFRDVFFADSQYGWVVGEKSKILVTTNGGDSWVVGSFISHTLITINKVFANNAGNLWVGGTDGIIAYSTDTGITWTKQHEKANTSIYDITFSSPSIGYAVGSSGLLLKTTNGGSVWNEIDLGTGSGLNSVSFPTEDIGYVVGDLNKFYKTTNAGKDWEDMEYTGLTVDLVNCVSFVTKYTGWISGLDKLMAITTDGGKTWASQDIPVSDPNFYFLDMVFLDSEHGFASGSDGNIFRYNITE